MDWRWIWSERTSDFSVESKVVSAATKTLQGVSKLRGIFLKKEFPLLLPWAKFLFCVSAAIFVDFDNHEA